MHCPDCGIRDTRTKHTQTRSLAAYLPSRGISNLFLQDVPEPFPYRSSRGPGAGGGSSLEPGQRHGPQEGSIQLAEALEGHGQPGPPHPSSQRHLPLHHVRQLLFDGPVRVDLNGIIVVKQLGELGQPTGERSLAHIKLAPLERKTPPETELCVRDFSSRFPMGTHHLWNSSFSSCFANHSHFPVLYRVHSQAKATQ